MKATNKDDARSGRRVDHDAPHMDTTSDPDPDVDADDLLKIVASRSRCWSVDGPTTTSIAPDEKSKIRPAVSVDPTSAQRVLESKLNGQSDPLSATMDTGVPPAAPPAAEVAIGVDTAELGTPGAYAVSISAGPTTTPETNDSNSTLHPEQPLSTDVEAPQQADQEDVAVANLVMGEENLPSAEEVREEARTANKQNYSRTSILLVLLAGAALLALIVGVSVGLSSRKSPDKDQTSPGDAGTTAIPPLNNVSQENNLTLAEHVLAKLPEDIQQSLSSDDPSLGMAFQWLLEDPFIYDYTDARVRQRLAMATLYYSTEGDSWVFNDHWLDYYVHECDWFSLNTFGMKDAIGAMYPNYLMTFFPDGVIPPKCNSLGLYQHLWLDTLNLVGSLPEAMYLLTSLKTFSVSYNRLEGTVSPKVGQLVSLEGLVVMGLVRNSGRVPSELGLLSNTLRGLILSDNDHEGSLPSEIWKLSRLETFSTATNKLTGTISNELQNLSKLHWLSLDENQYSGTMPSHVGTLTDLTWLTYLENHLTGTVPSEIGNLGKLQIYTNSDNLLTGTIPTQLGRLSNLLLLAMRSNRLEGTLPTELGSLTSLSVSLRFQNNPLVGGPIPSELGLLEDLQELVLYNCSFSGSVPQELSQLTALALLDLADNSLEQAVPVNVLQSLQTSLHTVNLRGNPNLSGSIPESLCVLNGTCMEGSLSTKCGERVTGLSFDCSEQQLCGCGCPC